MKTTSKSNLSQRIGAKLGKSWQGWLRVEKRFSGWLAKIKCPAGIAKRLPRALILITLVSLLFLAFKIFFMIIVMMIVVAFLNPSKEEPEERYVPGDVDDHRQSIHYHPMNYCDDPDPRFED